MWQPINVSRLQNKTYEQPTTNRQLGFKLQPISNFLTLLGPFLYKSLPQDPICGALLTASGLALPSSNSSLLRYRENVSVYFAAVHSPLWRGQPCPGSHLFQERFSVTPCSGWPLNPLRTRLRGQPSLKAPLGVT